MGSMSTAKNVPTVMDKRFTIKEHQQAEKIPERIRGQSEATETGHNSNLNE